MIRNQRTEHVTSDLAGVVCRLSRMASSFIRTRVVGAGALRPFMRAGVFCFLSAVFFPVHAEDLPDPTRPPASIFAPAAGTGVGRKAGANSSAGLHSIIISETRRAAIIDGQTVELGEQHGNARLVEVNVGSVVLQHGKSRQNVKRITLCKRCSCEL